MKDVYQEVTNKIVEAIETNNVLPWVKGWSGASSVPCNAITKRKYNGINRILLAMSGFASNEWATYNQWSGVGAQVRKGEKATTVVLYKPFEKVKENGEKETFLSIRTFSVFNRDQVDNAPEKKLVERTEQEIIEEAERVIDRATSVLGAKVTFGGDTACFIPSVDAIRMPERKAFKDDANYYATYFHELVHWTGAKDRLNRDLNNRFGTEAYAFEELVAELGAAFVCADTGVKGDVRHEGYIQSWLKVLKSDKKAIFTAASLAQKATGYLLEEVESEEE